MLRRMFLRHPLALLGASVVMLVTVVAVLSPWIGPFDPLQVDIENKLKPPSGTHPFGTDEVGRDVLSRVLAGARVSLVSSVIVIAICFPFGSILGITAGYLGGSVDEIIMRITDVFLAVPGLILALAISAALGPSLQNALLALIVVWWPWYTRITRSVTLHIKELEYVQAAKAEGLPDWAIILRHLVPNCLGPAIVAASMDMGFVILHAASLSFIGLGAQPPQPEWGAMLSTARVFLRDAWWTATFPGAAIFTTVLGFNVLGDSLRDFLDPKLR